MLRTDHNLVMIRVVLPGDGAGVRQLAELRGTITFEADRECFDAVIQQLTHQRDYCAGVNTAAQESTEWDVAHQVFLHRVLQ